jgi:rhamnose utilization protein RhaD (predicted bifunctional aldolase and dehydrogenase)
MVRDARAPGNPVTSAPVDEGERRALRELSASLGGSLLRTQGDGGNTSIKLDGVMRIEASGTQLADALAQEIMTPVRLDPLRKAITNRDPCAATPVDFENPHRNTSGPRPSIETSVHAVIPPPVVVHFHRINTIAFAVRSDGESLGRERLRPYADLVSAFVPYRKPGLPLACAISERLTKSTNVFVLANNGRVVADETVAEVGDRIARVCDAFSALARLTSKADTQKLALLVERADYRLPQDSAAHAIALDEESRDRAARLTLS